MPVRLLNSSVFAWPDRQAVEAALRRWAQHAAATRSDIRRIGYFGSYARGDWGVGSDLDVVIVVAGSDTPFARRSAEFDLTQLPVPAEALVYTEEEWRRLDPASRFARTLAHEVVWVHDS